MNKPDETKCVPCDGNGKIRPHPFRDDAFDCASCNGSGVTVMSKPEDELPVDGYGRRIRDDRTVPDLATAQRFDLWRGGVLDPGTVLTYWRHAIHGACVGGWVRSAAWWFVCGQCHPTAVDEGTGESRSSRTANHA